MARTTQSRDNSTLHPSARRAWPRDRMAGMGSVSVPGMPRFWLRQDVLAYALIAFGPQRVQTIVAAIAPEAASDDRWFSLPNRQRVCDRTGAFIRMADFLYPTGQIDQRFSRPSEPPARRIADKLAHDPAYDLSDMDLDGLLRTYRRFCRQPLHPVTVACLREMARRQVSLAS